MKKLKSFKKKANRKPKIQCGVCTQFWKSRKRIQKGRDRECKVLNEYVSIDSTACDNVELYRFIFCNKLGGMRHSIVCLYNQNKKYPGCSRCREGKVVKYLIQNGAYDKKED